MTVAYLFFSFIYLMFRVSCHFLFLNSITLYIKSFELHNLHTDFWCLLLLCAVCAYVHVVAEIILNSICRWPLHSLFSLNIFEFVKFPMFEKKTKEKRCLITIFSYKNKNAAKIYRKSNKFKVNNIYLECISDGDLIRNGWKTEE